MEFTFKEVPMEGGKKDSLVYVKDGAIVCIAKMSPKVYAPNFSFVCIANTEMTKIRQLIAEAKVNGTDRITRSGKSAKDYSNEVYNIALISLENGKLVDVSFKESTHPFYGLSFKWIEQSNGATQLTTDANYTYFPPNGQASYDLGFRREKVKVADTKFVNGAWLSTYEGQETFITIPSMATSEGFTRAARGMKLLESAIEFAGQHMTAVVNSGVDNNLMNAVGANMPV